MNYPIPKEVIDFRKRYALDIKAYNELSITLPENVLSKLKEVIKLMPEQLEGMILDYYATQDLILKKEGILLPSNGIQYIIENELLQKKQIEPNNKLKELGNKLVEQIAINNNEETSINFNSKKNQDLLSSAMYIHTFPMYIQEILINYVNLVPPYPVTWADFKDDSYDQGEEVYTQALMHYEKVELPEYEKEVVFYEAYLIKYNVDEEMLLPLKAIANESNIARNLIYALRTPGLEESIKEIIPIRELSLEERKTYELVNHLENLVNNGLNSLAFSISTVKLDTYLDTESGPITTKLSNYIVSSNADAFKEPISERTLTKEEHNGLHKTVEFVKYDYISIKQLISNISTHYIFDAKEYEGLEIEYSLDSLEKFKEKLQRLKEKEKQENVREETIQNDEIKRQLIENHTSTWNRRM